MTMDKIIEKYFGEDRVRYYITDDSINDNHHLSYQRKVSSVILSIGIDSCEDIPCFVCRTPEQLEKTILFILFGSDYFKLAVKLKK